MKNRSPAIAAALVALICLASVAYAAPSKIDDFLSTTADAILKFFAEMSRKLVVLGSFWSRINAIKYEVYDNLPYHLSKKLDVTDPQIAGISGYFIRIILPLYVTAILLTGMYLIFFSGSPHGRSRAKYMLRNLILGMFLVSMSIPIMQLLQGASATLVESILAQGPLNIGFIYKKGIDYLNYRTADFMWSNIAVAIPFILTSLFLAAGLFMMLAIRYFMIIFLTAFFPCIIFLSMFGPTRNIGNTLVKQLFFWSFLPAGYALALITISVGSQTLAAITPEVYNLVSLSGTFLLITTPLVMFGLMNWLTVITTPLFSFFISAPPMTVAEESAGRKKRKAEDETPAVGSRGYEKETQTKKRTKSALEYLGLEEYGTTEVPTSGVEEKPKEEGGYYPGFAKSGAGTAYGYAAAGGAGAGRPPVQERITPEIRKSSPLVVIPPKSMPNISMEMLEGDSDTLSIIVRNDGDETLNRVSIFDQDLEDAGFGLKYSENFFRLKKGEEKLIKVKITCADGMEPRSYIGTISFKTERGLHSWIDVTIKTREKAGAAVEGTQEAPAKAKYKRRVVADDATLTGMFGTTTAPIPGKKAEAPRRTGFPNIQRRVIADDSTLTGFFGTTTAPIPEKKEQPAPPKTAPIPAPRVVIPEPQPKPEPPKAVVLEPQQPKPEPPKAKIEEPAPTPPVPAPEQPQPAPEAPKAATPVPEKKPFQRPKYQEPEPEAAPKPAAQPQQEPPKKRVEITKKQVEEVERHVEKQTIGVLETMKPLTSLIRPAKGGKFLRRNQK